LSVTTQSGPGEIFCGGSPGLKIHLITDNGTTFVSGYFAKELKKQIIEGRDIEIFEHVRIGYRMPEHIGSIERYHGNCKQECLEKCDWWGESINNEQCGAWGDSQLYP